VFEARRIRRYDGIRVGATFVSVIVCTRNRPQYIGPCVSSILGQSHPSLEILVIDQSDADDSGAIVRGLDHPRRDALIYHRSFTRGLSRSRNVGIGMSHGEVVAFTDDDVVADEHWIRNLVDDYGRHPGISILFGRVLPYGGSGKGIVGLVETKEERLYTPDHRIPYGIGGGNNMTFRRSVFDRIGLFDERFGVGARFRGAEDVDIIFRAFAAGMAVLYSPAPVVYHRHTWESGKALERLARDYNFSNGAFIGKHIHSRTAGIVKVLVFRLWRHALSAIPSGLFRRNPRRILEGLMAIRDHLGGVFAGVQD
jgi:glycosyltransferase involved in cell wall biosynthesis